MNDIHLFRPVYRVDETLAEIRQCLECGWTGLGYRTLEFERAWKDYTGVSHAHFVNSATAGLHLAVHILKQAGQWQAGDEVITTPLSFVSTNHVLLYEGLKPVFADVDAYLCADPNSILNALTPRTRAVLFVGLGGSTGQLHRIAEICLNNKLRLIIDAAHMAGTRLNGSFDWTEYADATVFSFHAVKNLPTADSGMVCFAQAEHDALARQLSWLGIDKDTFSRTQNGGAYKWAYNVPHVGFKYHGNSVMAAMGLVGLRHLDQDNAYRRQLAQWYDMLLDGAVERVPDPPGCESARHLYQVLVPNRDEVMLALHAQGIYPGVHYDLHTTYPMYAQPAPPYVAHVSGRLLSLPLHLQLTYHDVARIAGALKEAVA